MILKNLLRTFFLLFLLVYSCNQEPLPAAQTVYFGGAFFHPLKRKVVFSRPTVEPSALPRYLAVSIGADGTIEKVTYMDRGYVRREDVYKYKQRRPESISTYTNRRLIRRVVFQYSDNGRRRIELVEEAAASQPVEKYDVTLTPAGLAEEVLFFRKKEFVKKIKYIYDQDGRFRSEVTYSAGNNLIEKKSALVYAEGMPKIYYEFP